MAVFPDRIVLKNSTDNQATIEAAIQTGGTDEITQGEIVLGINPTNVQFYTKAGDGSIVTLGGTSTSTLGGLTDVDLSTPATDGQVIAYNAISGNWEPVDQSGGGGYIDPLTTNGDIVIRSGGVTTRLGIGTSGQVLTVTGGIPSWENAAGGATSINDLTDVDTSTTPPTSGQVLEWSGSNWVPATPTPGGVTSIIAGSGISVDQATGDVTITVTGGGGGGSIAGTVLQKSETQTATSGAATFVGLGASGILVDITSSLDAWIVLYPTAADRTADAARAYGTDPAPGSGVLAEFYVTAGGTVLASPGTTYFNNDTPDADALYAAVRNQAGAAVNSQVTIKAYVHQNFGGTGTNRVTDSGTASSGTLDLTGMGQSGQFCTVTSSLDAWVVFYGSAADRTADSGRAFGADPTPGSGVQAEFYVAAGSTVLATPGAMYFNNDTDPTDAMYLAVRDTGGASVNSLITVKVYAETSYTGISGGTFGSG